MKKQELLFRKLWVGFTLFMLVFYLIFLFLFYFYFIIFFFIYFITSFDFIYLFMLFILFILRILFLFYFILFSFFISFVHVIIFFCRALFYLFQLFYFILPFSPPLGVLLDIGLLHRLMGNLDLAETTLNQTLTIQQKTLPHKHSFVSSTLCNLAAVHRQRGNYIQSEKLINEALSIDEQLYGRESNSYSGSLMHLAHLHRERGISAKSTLEIQKSIDTFRTALEIEMKKNSKSRAPTYASLLINIATALLSLAEFDRKKRNDSIQEAGELLSQAEPFLLNSVGKKHIFYSQYLSARSVYLRVGPKQYTESQEMSEKAMEIDIQAYGYDSVWVARDLRVLAYAFKEQGKYVEALESVNKALDICSRKFPGKSDHLDVKRAFELQSSIRIRMLLPLGLTVGSVGVIVLIGVYFIIKRK
jgi:tetratricopeptide (TPR) repeat protein